MTSAKNNISWLRLFRFGTVGLLGFFTDMALFAFFYSGVSIFYVTAQAFSFVGAVSQNFLLNKFWTFQAGGIGCTKRQYVQFFLLSLTSLGLRTLLIFFLVEQWNWNPYSGLVLGVGIMAGFNYLGSEFWVFQRQVK